ncbi:MAG: Jag N-terminal domain-containing protein [Proteobacteria bacterium]|nr:Jag N-terminal domain-containing protein [Pseudomonadota bacterium]MBU1714188.1 Jag N-terminal domain-containing protein [Pseudomonadota bacterium]
MSSKLEYQGSDVAEAIQNACQKMNVAQDELDIEVVAAGSAGIFGLGKKKAKIMVVLKNAASPGGGGRRPRKDHDERKRDDQRPKGQEKPPATVTAEGLEKIKNDLVKIVELMGFPSVVEISNEKNRIKAHLSGDYIDQIVGPEGQALDGLQYLMRKIISKNIPGKVIFSLDAGEYRDKRRQELEEKSLELAAEVRETSKTRSIPALNPAERRIVHMTLQDDTTIRSRSVGEGHFKKILIYVPGKGRKKSSVRKR